MTAIDSSGVAEQFREHFGRPPDGVWQAPGRVNLIGDHTDYNAGCALPFAIDRRVLIAAGRRRDGEVHCWSAQAGGEVIGRIGSLFPQSVSGWGAYPLGVFWAFGQAGIELGGIDLAVTSTLPVGRGLSSSAALTAAVAVAVDELAGTGLGPLRLVQACHQAESDFVGVPVGMLDQLAVVCGRRDHATLIDFRDLDQEWLPLALGPLVVVDTGVRRRVGEGGYAERRRQCQEAAARLGVSDLRQVDLADVEARLDGVLRARARHVVTENARVLAAAARLRVGQGIGDLLWASHASLRDDFAVSCPELDAVVEVAALAGADGARLTGAGFGGCAIVVGLPVEHMTEALREHLGQPGPPIGLQGRPGPPIGLQGPPGPPTGPVAFAVTASGGAGRLS